MRLISALLLSLTIGCGSDGSNPVDPGPDANTTPSGWTELIGRNWVVPAGSFDTYKCTRIQVQEDTWIAGFSAIAPQGTHHTVVTISESSTQLGDYECQASSLDFQMLYASGVATDELLFPEGVAMKVKAGQYINLNLHLFNAGEAEISGRSGILIKTIDAAAVQHEADMTFAGKINFEPIPPGDNQEIRGGCTLGDDWNVFTLWPHMHQYAKHAKMVVTPPDGAPITLHDAPYNFEEQTNYPTAAMVMPAGTRIDVTCTYNNDTNPAQNIGFGDSSNEEMCFIGMYKWPAGGHLFQCSI